MRNKLESWLLGNWYSTSAPPSLILRILEPLYRQIVKRRRRSIKPDVLPRPVIVVGNLTVGGSGKTPLVIALCKLLTQHGLKPGVISRGHGRSSQHNKRVLPDDGSDSVGDEPLLIARQTGVPVAVAKRRIEAAELLAEEELDLLIADDGLQHYQLPRAMEICVIDGQRRFGNGHLLPAGPLREPIDRLANVDFIVTNSGTAGQGEHPMKLRGDRLVSLDGEQSVRLTEWHGKDVDAIAGIGNPQRFFDQLREAGLSVHEKTFPDHHRYCAEDFNAHRFRPLIMTEKDAVKCMTFELGDAWCLPVNAELSDEFKTAFLQKVDNMMNREQVG